MSYGLGVDLGVTFSAAAVRRAGGVEMVSLGDRSVAVPSVLLVRDDGMLVSGDAAERRSAAEPSRVAREVKRRLGDPTPLILAGRPFPAATLLAAQLTDILTAASRLEGQPPAQVVLTHPAVWGPYRREQFAEVPRLAGLNQVHLVSEPQAAAAHYAANRRLTDGDTVVVYDLGGGTFDTAVLRADPGRIHILGTPEGIEHLGGTDFDQAILDHVDDLLDGHISRLDPTDPPAAATLTQLRRDCVLAKETLSTQPDTIIPVYLPTGHRDVRLTRAAFEDMIRPLLPATLDAVHRALHSAAVRPADLASVLLVGGSTKIPLVTRMIADEFNRPIRTDTHPKHAVALGAARLATRTEAAQPRRATHPQPNESTQEPAAAGWALDEEVRQEPAGTGRAPLVVIGAVVVAVLLGIGALLVVTAGGRERSGLPQRQGGATGQASSPSRTTGGPAPSPTLATTTSATSPPAGSRASPPEPPRQAPTTPVPSRSVPRRPARDSTLLAHWLLAGNAADSSGSNHPGTATGGVSFTSDRGGSAVFDGSSGAITAGHLLDTRASFTVASWVKLTSNADWATAISQDGTEVSGFYLQYDALDRRWAFARLAADNDAAEPIRAVGPAPKLNVWTHLAGVYEGRSHRMYLYVNGALTAIKTNPTPVISTGPLAVGRGFFAGVPTDWFKGSISDVRVYSRALSAGEIGRL